MRKRAGDARQASALAHADLIVVAIDLAVERTNLARTQRLNRFCRALLKKAPLECAHVCRNKIPARQNKSPTTGQLKRRSVTAIKTHVHVQLESRSFIKLNAQRPTLNSLS